MSILIIAIPRTGSTSLLSAIGGCLNYRIFPEPFANTTYYRKWHGNDEPQVLTNVDVYSKHVVKTMVNHLPKDIDFRNKNSDIFETNGDVMIEWQKEFSKRFNHTIILDRLDSYDQAKSHVYARETTKRRGRHHFQLPYDEGDLNDLSSNMIEKTRKGILTRKKKLEVLSNELKIPITFYENVFSEDELIRLEQVRRITETYSDFNKELYLEITNPINRLRKLNIHRKLI